uniref:Uncharacterized protein n=1 Tax=Megaselia scalaris TaxID=36166 RepID=T1GGS1_MEGSC
MLYNKNRDAVFYENNMSRYPIVGDFSNEVIISLSSSYTNTNEVDGVDETERTPTEEDTIENDNFDEDFEEHSDIKRSSRTTKGIPPDRYEATCVTTLDLYERRL